jgi:hypothetical protein
MGRRGSNLIKPAGFIAVVMGQFHQKKKKPDRLVAHLALLY